MWLRGVNEKFLIIKNPNCILYTDMYRQFTLCMNKVMKDPIVQFQKIDGDGDGQITKQEFLEFTSKLSD